MVKQTKTFKKGNVTKKALSAILAASMVMTSSSFVMAAPVEVEAVDVVEDVNAGEEQVGVTTMCYFEDNATFTISADVDDQCTAANIYSAIQDTIVPRKENLNGTITDNNTLKLSAYVKAGDYYTVTVTGANNYKKVLTAADSAMPTKAGQYKITISGTENTVGAYTCKGTTTGILEVKHNVTEGISVKFKNSSTGLFDVTEKNCSVAYTGSAVEPEFKLFDEDGNELVKDTDYEIVKYGNNIEAAAYNDKVAAPYVEVLFKNYYSDKEPVRYYFTISKVKVVLNGTNTSVSVTNNKTVYNADVQQPELKVVYTPANGTPIELKKDVDYKVTVKTSNESAEVAEPKNAGKYTVIIEGINNYSGTVKPVYEIKKQDFTEANVTVETKDVPYMGTSASENRAKVVVKDSKTGKVLKEKTDYKLYYYNDSTQGYVDYCVATKPGKYAIKVQAYGTNYNAGEIRTSYSVVDMADSLEGLLAKKKITFGNSTNSVKPVGNEYTYDKDGTVPATVKIGGREFKALGGAPTGTNGDSDDRYDVIFPEVKDCKEVGTYAIQVVGKGVWAGQSATLEYKVVPEDMSVLNITTAEVYKDHSGNLTVNFNNTLKDNCHSSEYMMAAGKDYTYTLKKTNATYTIEVAFSGNYKGKAISADETVLDTKLPLSAEAITGEVTGEYIYTGAKIRPTIDNIVLKENGEVLRKGIDYETNLAYGDNKEVGQGTVIVTGKGDYAGTRTITFEIKAGETVKDNYVLDTKGLKAVYETGTGTSFNPANDLKVKTTTGRVLASSEYSIKYYKDGKEVTEDVAKTAGTYTMEITVKETKTVLTAAYRVATSLDKAANVKDIADQAFTGSAVEPAVTVVKNATNVELVKGTDYVVSYTNNVKQGTATVTVEGIGDYYGTITKTFKIAGQAEQSIEVLAAQARDIQNRTLNSTPTVVKFEAGKAPKTAVTYESSDEDVVKVDETGKITYTGLGEATITIKAAETAEYKAAEATMTVKVGLAKPSFTPFSKNNAFTLTSSTVKGAQKFEVQYATKKDFSNAKTKTFATTSAGKVRQVKVSAGDKTTYFVRVRAISGTTKSAWSATKTVATK